MSKARKKLLTDWVLPIAIFLILYLTGWYKPLAIGMQRVILSTGIIKPGIELESSNSDSNFNYNWTLKELDGPAVPLSKFKGKVIFLNYFATWCPPCVAEMPGIVALYEELEKDERFAFIIISRDENDQKVRDFMTKRGYTLPVYVVSGRIPEEIYSNVLPTTYIVAPDGRIVSEHEGMADYDNEKVRNALLTLASGKSERPE